MFYPGESICNISPESLPLADYETEIMDYALKSKPLIFVGGLYVNELSFDTNSLRNDHWRGNVLEMWIF